MAAALLVSDAVSAEAEAARAAEAAREEAAREEAGNKKQKKGDAEKTSLYASQKPMSQKAKYRKGTRNPAAWR